MCGKQVGHSECQQLSCDVKKKQLYLNKILIVDQFLVDSLVLFECIHAVL